MSSSRRFTKVRFPLLLYLHLSVYLAAVYLAVSGHIDVPKTPPPDSLFVNSPSVKILSGILLPAFDVGKAKSLPIRTPGASGWEPRFFF